MLSYALATISRPLSAWRNALIPAAVVYLAVVYLLRHRRASSLPKRYGLTTRTSFARMTVDDAQSILKDLTELEFPKIFGFSIIFALFKEGTRSERATNHIADFVLIQTYGISNVSSLLVSTGELSNPETASKRTADTGVLLLEFALNKPSSERTMRVIARMNYLHARYQKSGKIRDCDMLYTLSLFALEPGRWVDKYEWRSLTQLELCACGTYWKSMGDAMLISYGELPSHKQGWTDGLHWLQEMEKWSLGYEDLNMVPAATNHQLANAHLDVLFLNLSPKLASIGKNIVAVLLGENLRKAMMFPEPSPTLQLFLVIILNARKYLLKYCFLPRPDFMRKQYIPTAPDSRTGRYNSVEYLSYPWYVKPSMKSRWGPRAWITWVLRRKLPGDDGNKYMPEGYTFDEVGPITLRGKGISDMDNTRARLLEQRRSGCPFLMP